MTIKNFSAFIIALFAIFTLTLAGCSKTSDPPLTQAQLDSNQQNGKEIARMNAIGWMNENLPECNGGGCTVAGDVDSYVGVSGCSGGDGWSEWHVKQLKKENGTVIGSVERMTLQCRTFSNTGCYTMADAMSGSKKDYLKNKCNDKVPRIIPKGG
jgi:hypothetical protein